MLKEETLINIEASRNLGFYIATIKPYPNNIWMINAWIGGLEKKKKKNLKFARSFKGSLLQNLNHNTKVHLCLTQNVRWKDDCMFRVQSKHIITMIVINMLHSQNKMIKFQHSTFNLVMLHNNNDCDSQMIIELIKH